MGETFHFPMYCFHYSLGDDVINISTHLTETVNNIAARFGSDICK